MNNNGGRRVIRRRKGQPCDKTLTELCAQRGQPLAADHAHAAFEAMCEIAKGVQLLQRDGLLWLWAGHGYHTYHKSLLREFSHPSQHPSQ